MKTLLVNLFAGPGTGKSTTAAAVFSELKFADVNCELVTEYAKDKVWERSYDVLDNQLYIFGKQYHRLFRLDGEVDVIITDAPILLSQIYGRNEPKCFHDLVQYAHNQFHTLNYFLIREKRFNPKGRLQDEEQARQLDQDIKNMLIDNDVEFKEMRANKTTISGIALDVMCELVERDKV